MLRFLSTVGAVLVGLILFVVVLPLIFVAIASVSGPSEEPMPSAMVLELDLRQAVVDAPATTAMPAGFGGPMLTVVGIVEGLEQAKGDEAVKGLYVRTTSGLDVDPAQAEEIRDAIEDFRASGKFVVSHVQDLSSQSLGGYYLATASDELYMQPNGQIFSSGFGLARMFFKGTLDKLDSSVQALHYHEYKTALHSYIHTEMTESQEESEGRLIQSIFDEYAADIAKAREMEVSAFVAKLDGVPYIGQEAVDAGLIDKLGYDVDAEEAAIAKGGEDAELVSFSEYAENAPSPYETGAVIAFVHGEGPVLEGEAPDDFFGGSPVLAGDTITNAILEAIEDEDVKAIVFRVNSPGGSPIASDQIWNAIERAQAAGKPVIINMSGVAASGGYWVAMGADKIVAMPTTITGSIGVVGGKFILKGLYDKVGVTVDELPIGGDKVFMFSDQRPFTPEEWLALRESFDAIYGDFTRKVAEGRGLPLETVEAIAKGRPWTGADAKERGLVDELGGLKTAIKLAKEAAAIPAEEAVELRRFPAEKTFFEQVFMAFGTSARAASALAGVAEVLQLEPAAEFIGALKEAEEVDGVKARAANYEVR